MFTIPVSVEAWRQVKLTKNFSLYEALYSSTAAQLGILSKQQPTEAEKKNILLTLANMEQVRSILGAPVSPSSLFRAEAINRAVGGSATSDHRKGLACDFTSSFGTPRQICEAIIKAGLKFDQLILEFPTKENQGGSWVHIGFGSGMRQQVLTAVKVGGTTKYLSGLAKA